jgi:hypothetical protein
MDRRRKIPSETPLPPTELPVVSGGQYPFEKQLPLTEKLAQLQCTWVVLLCAAGVRGDIHNYCVRRQTMFTRADITPDNDNR